MWRCPLLRGWRWWWWWCAQPQGSTSRRHRVQGAGWHQPQAQGAGHRVQGAGWHQPQAQGAGHGVQGAGCRVQGGTSHRHRVQGTGCRVQGGTSHRHRVQGTGCRVQGAGCRVAPAAGTGCRVQGGCRARQATAAIVRPCSDQQLVDQTGIASGIRPPHHFQITMGGKRRTHQLHGQPKLKGHHESQKTDDGHSNFEQKKAGINRGGVNRGGVNSKQPPTTKKAGTVSSEWPNGINGQTALGASIAGDF
jgi:hypothetical protein